MSLHHNHDFSKCLKQQPHLSLCLLLIFSFKDIKSTFREDLLKKKTNKKTNLRIYLC